MRDIGGIIVIDFIDMVLESNRDLVHRRLIECLSRDRTKHQVAEVTSLGLVQMTRKKLGLGLLETFSEPCEVCAGRGVIVHHEPVTRHRGNDGTDRRSFNQHFYDGKLRELHDLMDAVPGGFDAIRALIEVLPELGEGRPLRRNPFAQEQAA